MSVRVNREQCHNRSEAKFMDRGQGQIKPDVNINVSKQEVKVIIQPEVNVRI